MTADELAAAAGAESAARLRSDMDLIRHCAGQLSEGQFWHRPRPDMNSVANLLRHLDGNVRQMVLSGVAGRPDARDREREFLDRSGDPKATVLAELDAALAEVTPLLEAMTPAQMAAEGDVGSKSRTGLNIAFTVAAHFASHAQEIVHMTRLLLGDAYRFKGKPPYPAMTAG